MLLLWLMSLRSLLLLHPHSLESKSFLCVNTAATARSTKSTSSLPPSFVALCRFFVLRVRERKIRSQLLHHFRPSAVLLKKM
jgi:hypothetical protein